MMDCLEKVRSQTWPPTHLIIVDNASTDGTDALLAESGLLKQPDVAYLRLAENTGGAGGFNSGFEAAMRTDADWIWCMDDDVAPEPDCLERLMGVTSFSECVHPLVLYSDGTAHEWEHLFDPSTTLQIGLGNRSFRNGKPWCSVHVACFEGMLASRRIVEAVGMPERNFFIYADDGYFGFLAAAHTNVLYVRDARMLKKIKPDGAISPFRMYYDLRNRFLLRRKIAQHIPLPRYSRYTFALFMVCYTWALLRATYSRQNLVAALRAWRDGYRGLVGRRHY